MTARLATVLPVVVLVGVLALLLVLAGCATPTALLAAAAPTTDRTVVPLAASPQAPEMPGRPDTVPERPLTVVSRLEQSRPVALAVPAIGLRVGGLLDLRPDAGGVLQVPADPAAVGWSTLAPTPGARGAAVIAAHEDGMFGRLPELTAGDRVSVYREDGTEAVFTVYRTARFPRAAFPAADVHGDTPAPELRLVTAGGVFDRDGSTPDNLVVFARLDGIR